MKITQVLLAALAAIALAGISASVRASTVYTESFEGTLAGTLSGDVAVHESGTMSEDYFGQATDGTHILAFNQNNSDEGVQDDSFTSSEIPTLSGYLYTLTFDYGMFNSPGPQMITVTATDTVTTSALLTQNISDGTGSTDHDTVLSPYSFNFTGSGNPIVLEFLDTTSNPVFSDGLLDHIVLTVNPEPASLGLLGVGSLLLTMRRRRR